MMQDSINIRAATVNDLPALVAIHKAAYSRSHFTSLLSDTVLARYYGLFLTNGSEICLAINSKAIVGFAVYGKHVPERISEFKKSAISDILMVAIRHPVIASRKLLSAITSRLTFKRSLTPADFLLLSIAVSRPRIGVASRLLCHLTLVAQQQGESVVGLYVNADNTNAVNTYFSAGFVIKQYESGQFYMEKYFEK
jgi:ribosomal protein S18 acetylase RimI-like enzyme